VLQIVHAKVCCKPIPNLGSSVKLLDDVVFDIELVALSLKSLVLGLKFLVLFDEHNFLLLDEIKQLVFWKCV